MSDPIIWKFKRPVAGNPDQFIEEDVLLERWVWGVIYDDDTELHQFDSNGVFHQVGEIRQGRVKLMSLYKPHQMSIRHDLVVPMGATVFHRYKNYKLAHHTDLVRCYQFGFKVAGQNQNHKVVANILPDDRLVMGNSTEIELSNFNL